MNKNKLLKRILAISAVIAAFAVPATSQAAAMYARQTGQACATCHFQHYPLLNEYGRAFKAGGYTQIGKVLGHAQAATTQRYAHLQLDPVRTVADRTARKIAGALKGRGAGSNVVALAGRPRAQKISKRRG